MHEEIWNTGSFSPLSYIIRSFGKESRGVREWAGRRSTFDQRRWFSGRSYFRDFPFVKRPLQLLSGCPLRRKQDLPFYAANAASIRMTLYDEGYKISSQCLSPLRRLHGGGCQRKAKQIRSRNDAPVFPCCTRSMGQIGSCVCVYTRAPSRSCST